MGARVGTQRGRWGRTLVLLPPRWTPALRTTFLGAAFLTTFFTTFFGAAFFTTWWGCGWA